MSTNSYRDAISKHLIEFGRPASLSELAAKIGCHPRKLSAPMHDLIFAGEVRRTKSRLFESCSPKYHKATYKGERVIRLEILSKFSDVDTFTSADVMKKIGCSRQAANRAVRTLQAYRQVAFVRTEKNDNGKKIHVHTIKHREQLGVLPHVTTPQKLTPMERFWFRGEKHAA